VTEFIIEDIQIFVIYRFVAQDLFFTSSELRVNNNHSIRILGCNL